MFYENELRFLQKTLQKCHISSMVIDPGAPFDTYADQTLQQLVRNKRFSNSLYDMVPDLKIGTIYRLLDVFLCRYIFMKLPYTSHDSVLLIGPYLTNGVTEQQILEQGERMGVPTGGIRDLKLFYCSVPVVHDEHHLFALVNTYAENIFNGEDNFDNVDLYFNHSSSFLPELAQSKTVASEEFDAKMMESRYNFERELINAVSQGNAHKAELMTASFSNLAFENRTSDQLRNLKNYCIIMNTLMRKAAEKGRVHPIHLDRVSSEFARRIEGIHIVSRVTDFMLEMMRTYCRLVKRYSMQSYSPLVQKAMIYIENDLTADLTLRTVAAKFNVRPGYLSGLFKKDTGLPFTAFVNGRRIALARHLLKTTNLQVQTIVQHCGILDFHYFCRLFKKLVGFTPTEYRNSHVVNSTTL